MALKSSAVYNGISKIDWRWHTNSSRTNSLLKTRQKDE